MVDFPGARLAGFVCNTSTNFGKNYRDIQEFWQDYLQSGKMKKLHAEVFVKDHTEYGICFPHDMWNGNIEYFLGVKAEPDVEVPADYAVRNLPPADYAVFSSVPSDTPHFPQAIFDTWAFIFGQWLPKSDYEIKSGYLQFERYDERVFKDTGKVCEIYIPLQPRSSLNEQRKPRVLNCPVLIRVYPRVRYVPHSQKTIAVKV
jgi:AraC family transcriptional regulator